MPIYEYRCQACGHEFEKLQKISDAPITECPACHQQQVKKLISAAGFRLKGGGWYETDFKKNGKRNLAGEGADQSGSKSESTSESSTSSSSTSAASSETKSTSASSSSTDKVA